MKKFLIIASLLAVSSAFAEGTGTSGTQTGTQTSTSTSGSTSSSTTGASTSGATVTQGGVTVGCLVNCASTDQGSKDAADAAIQVALINAAAAKEIAKTDQVIKNTPSVSGPNLTTSNDTCMGSTSGSVNIAGLGIGGGTSWVDGNCKMLKNSRELWNMGMKAAALALMCTDSGNKEALELTGFECPQTTKARKEAEAAKVSQAPQYTDPIVRERLGLAPLAVAAK